MSESKKSWYETPIAIITFIIFLLGAGYSFGLIISNHKYQVLESKYEELLLQEREGRDTVSRRVIRDTIFMSTSDICSYLKNKKKDIEEELDILDEKLSNIDDGDYLSSKNDFKAKRILISQSVFLLNSMINENECNHEK